MITKTVPGLLCSGIEFFVVENEVKFIHAGKMKTFSELSYPIVELLKEEIAKDQNVIDSLLELQPNSEMKQVEQFVKCRLGGLDFKADIIENVIQEGEYWDCPNRGKCKHEGTLCKLPVFNNYRLEPVDVKLMQLSATEMTNEVIAEEMHMPLGTLHKLKKKIYAILEIQTKQESALIARDLNLI